MGRTPMPTVSFGFCLLGLVFWSYSRLIGQISQRCLRYFWTMYVFILDQIDALPVVQTTASKCWRTKTPQTNSSIKYYEHLLQEALNEAAAQANCSIKQLYTLYNMWPTNMIHSTAQHAVMQMINTLVTKQRCSSQPKFWLGTEETKSNTRKTKSSPLNIK